jgi:ACS family D-galactonate transporter-like MFS transporter
MNESVRPLSEVPSAAPSDRPTSVRWRIVGMLILFSFASWFLRVSMAVAYDERIEKQFQITPEAMGYVYSAFLLVYMLGQTPGGWFIDRYGPRRALLLMGCGLAVFCGLTGLVGPAVPWLLSLPALAGLGLTAAALALGLFLVVRSVMGVFAVPMYPAAAYVIGRWLPFPRQGWANGLVQGSACVGIAAVPLVFGALVDALDWPLAFLGVAVAVGVVTLLWAGIATDRPEQHPAVNRAERQLIQKGSLTALGPATASRSEHGVWLRLLQNRSLVFLTVSYAAVGYFEYLFFFWLNHYFKEQLRPPLPPELRRLYTSIPLLTMALGMAGGGWLSDRLVQAFGYRWGRALVPAGGMLAGAVFLALGIQASLGLLTTAPEWVVVWFALALGALGAVEGPFWMTALELGGRRGGTTAGICNTGGNVGGLVAPSVTPFVAGRYGWPLAIGLAGVVCVTGAFLWLWIDPRERVEAD